MMMFKKELIGTDKSLKVIYHYYKELKVKQLLMIL